MGVGDDANFWSVSVRPFQRNFRATLHDVTSVWGNTGGQTTEFAVTLSSPAGFTGGNLTMTFIRVTP
jgi:hypothetical protein